MKFGEFSKVEYPLFSWLGLFFIGLGFLAIVLAMSGIFYKAFFVAYFIAGILFFVWLFGTKKIKVDWDWNFVIFIVVLVTTISVFLYFSEATIFSGRDQGTLSETAIRLAQNHQLEFSSSVTQEFFKIYGPGKALNFPGFDYLTNGNVKTDFPIGYPAWLGVFFSFFGLFGFKLANGISAFFFLLAFYFLTLENSRKSTAVLATLGILTAFVFSWFLKFTLSENLAWMLFWFFIFQAYLFFKNENRMNLLCGLLSIGLLLFIRIEALAFLAIFIILLFLKFRSWKKISQSLGKINLVASGVFIFLYLTNILVNFESYLSLVKSMLKPLLRGDVGDGTFLGISPALYVFKLFYAYGMIFFVAFLILAMIFWWRRREKNWLLFVPIILALPGFFYLFSPNISLDHPWMLRRFVFSVIPVCIFYTFVFADQFFGKQRLMFNIFCVMVLLSNLSVTLLFVSFIPHKNLLSQISLISQNFKANDLVLVDKNATGDGWSMMNGPLNFMEGKQAAYFFNPEDLGKIDQKKFEAIYFIIPDVSLDFYRQADFFNKLQPVQDYLLENVVLDVAVFSKAETFNSEVSLPRQEKIVTYGKIYRLMQ